MYDLIIVGAGPAGLGASIYASRYKMSNLIIGSEIGGQVVEASEIENWAGERMISGKDLMDKFIDQTKDLGGEIVQSEVNRVVKTETGFEVYAASGEKYESKAIILALGMKPRKMNIKGEKELIGKGVSYCATCDAMFFRDKDVAVIGGGDAAAMAATHLSEFANKVYVIYKEGGLVWNPARGEEVDGNSKIEVHSCDNITGVKGEGKVSGLVYECGEGEKELDVQGVFVEIGSVPGVAIAQSLGVDVDDKSYIVVDQTQATNVENVYAAGDVTTGSNKFRQIITAVAEGAVAAGSVYRKLKLK
ncbi:NAD(P)/FAD-dependent oxidoreductase [Patescibacteria group bacterium]